MEALLRRLFITKFSSPMILHHYLYHTAYSESTPLNKLAVAHAVWARMPVDGLNMTLA